MRQVVIPRHGGPEVLEMREAPDPVPGEGEVRIRVRAAGINFADILARIGLYPDDRSPWLARCPSGKVTRCRAGNPSSPHSPLTSR